MRYVAHLAYLNRRGGTVLKSQTVRLIGCLSFFLLDVYSLHHTKGNSKDYRLRPSIHRIYLPLYPRLPNRVFFLHNASFVSDSCNPSLKYELVRERLFSSSNFSIVYYTIYICFIYFYVLLRFATYALRVILNVFC